MFEMTAVADGAAQNLTGILDWGLAVIRAFQAAGNPALTLLARFFTLLGDPVAYAIILPVLFWCIDEKRGFRVGLTLFLSNGINVAVKETLQVPRPFVRDPSVRLVHATGFSTPSGHSQNSAVLWPLLAWTQPAALTSGSADTRGSASTLSSAVTRVRRGFAVRAAISLGFPFCIGLSRIYLGVHYPTDVLLGWAIGALISVIALAAPQTAFVRRTLASIAASAAAAGRSLRTWKLAAAAVAALTLNAASGSDTSMGGLVFGFAAGYIFLCERETGFSATAGTRTQKALRVAVGLALLAVIYFGLKTLFPGEGSEYYSLFRFVRYGLLGLWASLGAPVLFMKTRLA